MAICSKSCWKIHSSCAKAKITSTRTHHRVIFKRSGKKSLCLVQKRAIYQQPHEHQLKTSMGRPTCFVDLNKVCHRWTFSSDDFSVFERFHASRFVNLLSLIFSFPFPQLLLLLFFAFQSAIWDIVHVFYFLWLKSSVKRVDFFPLKRHTFWLFLRRTQNSWST